MKSSKEEQCEREAPVDVDVVDDDDFAGLDCLPLYDLESETTTFDPSNLFDDVKLDERNLAILQKPKKPQCYGNFGKGKDLETLRLMLSAPPPSSCQQNPTGPTKSDAHHQRQDWDDEEKLENSKRKLHQGYQEFQNKRKRIQLLDVKNLPLPSKPQRGRVLSENKPLISSRKCPEPSDFSESQQNPKGPTKSTDHDVHHRQDWDDEEKLETSVRKLHQGYQEFQNKRKKIQLLDVKNLPLPSKPQRGRVLSENKPLISSRKCPEPSDFSESQQNPKGLTKSTDHDVHHRQDWDDEEKLETTVRKLHQGYQEFQNKRKKIQVIDIKSLPLPSKPGRGRVLTKNKFLTSSRKCRAF